ncbi:MAG: UvrD-helicase domain-containing protein, partial [Clostridia bacterium]
MSKYSFDPQQQAILDCEHSRQLVSAGAGSGKTTVMIQKIVDLLISGKATPNELLVVTFTNLASTEMRERLVKQLSEILISTQDESEKYRIQQLLDEVETASVDTIDGFCSKMLKKYFYSSNLEPEIKIISSFSQEYYINKALDQAIKKFNQTNEKDLIILCDIFEKKSRNLDNLKENLLKAFNYCICQKDYDKFLNSIVSQYQNLTSPSSQYLNNYICTTIYENANNALRLLPYFSDYEKLHKMMDSYCEHMLKISKDNNLMDNINILKTCPICSFANTERIKSNNDYEQLKYYADNLRTLQDDIKFLNNLSDNNLTLISSHLNSFVALLKQFVDTYSKLKQDNEVMDFGDLERKMLEILQTQSILEDFHNTYKYVFVDEYQDINPMQDELINTLLSSTSNLFLVGDVKQSIYGFRQSTPELFIETYKNYKSNNELGNAFDMKINFRSAPEILEFNNEIFCNLMTEKDADIDYAGTSKFDARNHDYPSTKAVEILVANSDVEPNQAYASGIYSVKNHINPTSVCSAHDIEALTVVNKIKELVGSQIYDAKTKQNRTIEYRDIAILSRGISNDKIQNLAQILTKHNIPINISKRTNLKDSEGVNKILSILKILNHTATDIDYTFLFTSPLISIDYNELLTIYTNHNSTLYDNLKSYINDNNDNLSIKIKYGFNLCNEFRIISSTMSVVELIETILNKYHLRQHLIACPNGYEQLNILDEFLNSLSIEERNLPISKFVDLVENNMSSSNEIISRDSLNSVTIQTIHASKGLEYPIVILFNCGQQFKYLTDYNDLNFNLDLGIGMQFFDLNNRIRLESPTRYAIKLKNREKSYKEELRLLYVATTRAKNKLIITGCCSESKLRSQTLPKDCYINLILSSYYGQISTNSLIDIYNFKNCTISLISALPLIISSNSSNSKTLASDAIVATNINFNYPYLAETNISVKNNVTALSRVLNDEYNIQPIKLNLNE